MKKKAVIIFSGSKYNICCDVERIPDLMKYIFLEDKDTIKELKLIFHQVCEGLRTKKYGDEPYGTKAMKPFINRENDRIICNVTKRPYKTQCIVISDFYFQKKSDDVNKVLKNIYETVSKYEYEIIE